MNLALEGEEDLDRSSSPQHKPTESSTVDRGPEEGHRVKRRKDVLPGTTCTTEEEPADDPPKAPKNTTQFLIEDKEEGPDPCNDPPVTREEFLLKNYFGEVERYHRERMETMTEQELKKEILELNQRLAQAEENLQLREVMEAWHRCLRSFLMRLRELERDMEGLLRYNQVTLQSHRSLDKN